MAAAKVTFVNQNDKSQAFTVNLYGLDKNRVKVAIVLAVFESSVAIMHDGKVMEADEDGLSMDAFDAGGTYTLSLVPRGYDGESSSKKLKRLHPSLDLEAAIAEENNYMQDLLAPPSDLPIGVVDLQEFISGGSRPLPVLTRAAVVSVRESRLVKLCSPAESGKIGLAVLVDVALNRFRERPNSEADSSFKLRSVTGEFLVDLNSLASADQKLLHLDSKMDSARTPGSASASSALVPLMRPDYALYIRDALILRWENKIDSAHFPSAMKENIEKLKMWSPLYYGELPYVIGGCCGGRIFQWLKLSPKGKHIVAEPISKQYDLWTQSSLAELLLSVVQMHRLLQKLQEKLTTPVPVKLYEEIKRRNGTVLLGPEYVLKTIDPKLPDDRVDFLQALYTSITGSKYLIQLKGTIRGLKGSTKLNLYPVGHPSSLPCDLTQLNNALHDMLHGLMQLHKAGYTHRDLRWENCIRVFVQGEVKWILIDLESAGKDGDVWEGEGLVGWDGGTLDAKQSYTYGSDLYELGKLVVRWLEESGEGSGEGKGILALGKRMMKKRGKAATILGNVCQTGCTRCAIFNS